MTKKKALIYISVYLAFFIAVPVFVLMKTASFSSGWRGLRWGSTEDQVNSWVNKNNMNYSFSKCSQSHFGVTCKKLTWKKGEVTDDEEIEFQFQDGKLCAVIETGKILESDPAAGGKLGKPLYGTDMQVYTLKVHGILYEYTDRAIFYEPKFSGKNGKCVRYIADRLVENVPSDESYEDKVTKYRLTCCWYEKNYFESIKDNRDAFQSKRFF